MLTSGVVSCVVVLVVACVAFRGVGVFGTWLCWFVRGMVLVCLGSGVGCVVLVVCVALRCVALRCVGWW